MHKAVVFILLCMFMIGCSTVTIRPHGGGKLVSPPSYEERKNFYFWGLSGEHRVKVGQVCKEGQNAQQLQSQQTFVDGLLGFVTIGIYAPHTVKVWCSK